MDLLPSMVILEAQCQHFRSSNWFKPACNGLYGDPTPCEADSDYRLFSQPDKMLRDQTYSGEMLVDIALMGASDDAINYHIEIIYIYYIVRYPHPHSIDRNTVQFPGCTETVMLAKSGEKSLQTTV